LPTIVSGFLYQQNNERSAQRFNSFTVSLPTTPRDYSGSDTNTKDEEIVIYRDPDPVLNF